jgi:hypothetical protein
LRQRGNLCIFFYWFWDCCDSAVFFVFFSIGFGTVATAWYFLYFFYRFWKYKKYHAVATVQKPIRKPPQNITPSEQFQNHKKKENEPW